MPFHEVRTLGGCPVGLLDGVWMAQMRDGNLCRLEASPSPGLVTLVEDDPLTFRDALVKQLRDRNLDASAAVSFPLLACVTMGLNWPSEHWQSHALRWVEALRLSNDVHPELKRLTTGGRTQHIRHWARRLARQAVNGGMS